MLDKTTSSWTQPIEDQREALQNCHYYPQYFVIFPIQANIIRDNTSIYASAVVMLDKTTFSWTQTIEDQREPLHMTKPLKAKRKTKASLKKCDWLIVKSMWLLVRINIWSSKGPNIDSFERLNKPLILRVLTCQQEVVCAHCYLFQIIGFD